MQPGLEASFQHACMCTCDNIATVLVCDYTVYMYEQSDWSTEPSAHILVYYAAKPEHVVNLSSMNVHADKQVVHI